MKKRISLVILSIIIFLTSFNIPDFGVKTVHAENLNVTWNGEMTSVKGSIPANAFKGINAETFYSNNTKSGSVLQPEAYTAGNSDVTVFTNISNYVKDKHIIKIAYSVKSDSSAWNELVLACGIIYINTDLKLHIVTEVYSLSNDNNNGYFFDDKYYNGEDTFTDDDGYTHSYEVDTLINGYQVDILDIIKSSEYSSSFEDIFKYVYNDNISSIDDSEQELFEANATKGTGNSWTFSISPSSALESLVSDDSVIDSYVAGGVDTDIIKPLKDDGTSDNGANELFTKLRENYQSWLSDGSEDKAAKATWLCDNYSCFGRTDSGILNNSSGKVVWDSDRVYTDNNSIINFSKAAYAGAGASEASDGASSSVDEATGTATIPVSDSYHAILLMLDYSIHKISNGDGMPVGEITCIGPDNEQYVVEITGESGSYNLTCNPEPNDLTEYQKASLKVLYSKLADTAGIKDENRIKSYQLSDTDDLGGNDLTENPVTEDQMKDLIEEFETVTFTSSFNSIRDVARLSSLLARYVIFHSVTDADSSDPSKNDFYNITLHTIARNWGIFNGESYVGEDSSGNLTYHFMPSLTDSFLSKGYGSLVNDAISGDSAFRNIELILQATSYAFDSAAESESGKDNGYTVDEITAAINGQVSDTTGDIATVSAWLEQCGSKGNYEANKLAAVMITDETDLFMFRSMIELYDLCNFLAGQDISSAAYRSGSELGMGETIAKEWSSNIYAYYKLVLDNQNIFAPLRNNTSLYGTGYTGGATVDNPLGVFFSVDGEEMSDKWNIGYSLSSLYVPMVTNLYDISTYDFVSSYDSEWLLEFFYRYGFHRKALYISTDPNIVVNNYYNKTSTNGTKVATLADLLNYDRDIQLYVDTNFYNAENIAGAIGKVDYATLYQYLHDEKTIYNVTDQASMEELKEKNDGATTTSIYDSETNGFIDETLNLDADTLLKTNGVTVYSVDVAKNVTKLGETADNSQSLYDGYVLTANAITGDESVFSLYQYTPMLGYAVVSAIYRDAQIYNRVGAAALSSKTVFESSKNILYCDGATNKDWLAYMNYIMLANLKSQMNVNVETQLDLNSPIFIDIFGNIVTESGYVIIPAASNPTLCYSNTALNNTWDPYTIGFGEYMSSGGYIPAYEDLSEDVNLWLTGKANDPSTGVATKANYTSVDEVPEETEETLDLDLTASNSGWFIYTADGLKLKNVYLQSNGLQAMINWDTINSNSKIVQQIFWDHAYYQKAMAMYCDRTMNFVIEVLRGAPIENIDYEKEGLTTVESSSAGIVIAYALDKLLTTISSKSKDFVNSIVTMPNVMFMPYLSYIIYFAVKISIAALILLFLVRLFMNGVRNRFGFKAVASFALTVAIVVSAIYILPNSIVWSYDTANSAILSTEASDMLLYNELRVREAQEIGITEVQQIDENTQLLVQVDKVNPNWMEIFGKALLTNEYSSFVDLFDDAMKDSAYYNMPGIVQKGSNVYIDTQTILDSTQIYYSKTANALYNKNVVRNNQVVTKVDLGGTELTEETTVTAPESLSESDNVRVIESEYPNVEHSFGDEPKEADADTDEDEDEDEDDKNKPRVTTTEDTVTQDYYAAFSFASPYYVILDQLIANVNEYNQMHNIQTYTAGVDSKGNVVTYDIVSSYLLSNEFQEDGYDILGLYDALDIDSSQKINYAPIFDETDKMYMKYSAWYPDYLQNDLGQERNEAIEWLHSVTGQVTGTHEERQKVAAENIDEVYDYAREFVANHKTVLKHIPDDAFIKILAFACAVKYNKVFNVPYADSIKLITVDNRDLMRFMLSDFNGVYSNYAYTFGRSVYKTTGTVGVILSAILMVIILLTTVLKPVLIMMLFILIIINIALRELILNKPNKGVEGYFIGCSLFMVINFMYAGLLKLCFFISNSNLSSITAMILCIVTQILYLIALVWLVWAQASDWANVGYSHYQNAVSLVSSTINRFMPQRYYQPYNYSNYGYYGQYDMRMQNGEEPIGVYMSDRRHGRFYRTPDTVNDMMERDMQRQRNAMYDARYPYGRGYTPYQRRPINEFGNDGRGPVVINQSNQYNTENRNTRPGRTSYTMQQVRENTHAQTNTAEADNTQSGEEGR